MCISPGAASATHFPQASHATEQSCVAASPANGMLHCTNNFWLSGTSSNRSLGQAAMQSGQARHFSVSTCGRPFAFMWIASNVQATSQSPRPRQPQEQPFPPPETTAAARQPSKPRYSAIWCACRPPPLQRKRDTSFSWLPVSTWRNSAICSMFSAVLTVHLLGSMSPETSFSANG